LAIVLSLQCYLLSYLNHHFIERFFSWFQVGLEGSANGQWWIDNIGKALDEGTSFHRVGSRQLAALLIAAWY
jgi:hypothetical protein